MSDLLSLTLFNAVSTANSVCNIKLEIASLNSSLVTGITSPETLALTLSLFVRRFLDPQHDLN